MTPGAVPKGECEACGEDTGSCCENFSPRYLKLHHAEIAALTQRVGEGEALRARIERLADEIERDPTERIYKGRFSHPDYVARRLREALDGGK